MCLIKVTYKWIVSNFFWKFGNGRDIDIMGIFQKHKIFTIERCQIYEHARM